MDLKQAVGIGARWLSPVGLVRLDIAKGLDPDADPFRIHLVIGPDL
jgi:translocation and assembly module TamA